jgi:hypothetical protein
MLVAVLMGDMFDCLSRQQSLFSSSQITGLLLLLPLYRHVTAVVDAAPAVPFFFHTDGNRLRCMFARWIKMTELYLLLSLLLLLCSSNRPFYFHTDDNRLRRMFVKLNQESIKPKPSKLPDV